MIIVIWVDDMIISGCKLGSIVCFKSWFGEHFELMDLGKLKYVLSILVEHDHTNCLIYILQKSYLKQVLECFGMSDLHPVSTPLVVGSTLSLSQSPQSEEDVSKYKGFANGIHYLSLVGSLLYAMQTCPDIQYAIGQIAQFSESPGVPHLQATKHILWYLREILGLKLMLGRYRGNVFNLVG